MGYPAINRSRAQTKRNLTYKKGRKVTHIVHHYTAGKGTAEENCIYFGRENLQASADFFIDLDGAIWQFNADLRNYYSWHCGCASKYTKWVFNSSSIGIEMVGTGAEFTQAQKDSLRALTLALMEDFGVPACNVVRHYDCNGVRKLCPFAYCGTAAKDAKWDELHAYVTGGEAETKPAAKPTADKKGGDTVNVTLKILKKGSKGEQVKTLQRLLKALGYGVGSYGVDGSFGADTDAAVRKYQKARKLDVDGVVGAKTWAALLGV